MPDLLYAGLAANRRVRYAVAVVVVILAFGFKLLLAFWVGRDPDTAGVFVVFSSAVLLSAAYGGRGPGLLATVLSALIGAIWFLPPYGLLVLSDDTVLVHTFLFVFDGLVVSFVCGALRTSRRHLLKEVQARQEEVVARTQAEQQAQRERQRWEITLASIGDAVIATDAEERVTFINSVAAALTGWARDEALGQGLGAVFNIINEETRAPVESPVKRVLEEGVIVGLANHTLLIARDGTERPIADSGAPIQDEGAARGAVLVFRDVTAERDAEARLQAARDQLDAILAGVADGVTVQDAHGNLVFVNEAAARASGFSSVREMLAVPRTTILERFELFDETGSPMSPAQLPGQQARRGVENPSVTLRFHDRKTGAERWVQIQTTAVYDAQGQVQLAISITHDITEQKRAEEAQRFLADASALMATSLDYITTLNEVAHLAVPTFADGCIIDMFGNNGTVEEIVVAWADPEREAIVRALRQRNLASDPPPELLQRLQRGEAQVYGTLQQVPSDTDPTDDEEANLRQRLGLTAAMIFPLHGHDRVLGAISFLAAESGRHYDQAEQALGAEIARRAGLAVDNARLYRDVQAALLTRDQFLSIAAHELRTPLTSLLASAQLLERRGKRAAALEPRDQQTVERIITQADRLNVLIEDLLDLSRIALGQFVLEQTPVDLVVVARQVVAEVQPTLERHTVTFTASSEQLVVLGDMVRLEQVLQNLVQNAIKYSPEGGAITMTATRRDSDAVIAIQDHGIGIPPDAQAQLFQRFYRASNVDIRRISGFGIGLYVVREIITRHGGTVGVESQEGQGSTFTISIPLVDAVRIDGSRAPMAGQSQGE